MEKTKFAKLSLIFAFALVLLFLGWKTFWFLTDDAFIAFRYVSNSILGYGYVWNAPPFLPVEGYTSFLWVIVLDVVWRVFNLEPPKSANVISLIFSFAILVLSSFFILKMNLNRYLNGKRFLFVSIFLVFLLLNRTFLAWTSSGLETAMFSFLLILWVGVFIFVKKPVFRAGFGALTASFLELARPDGYLFCIMSIIMILLIFLAERKKGVIIYGFMPFIIAVAHLLWRVSFYGEWLPNTYYAKYDGIWPISGVIYFSSFLLEYGLWFAIILILVALVGLWKSRPDFETILKKIITGKKIELKYLDVLILSIVVFTLFLHFCFYTFVTGGDHFEYRVYHHILPLLFIAFLWSLSKLRCRFKVTLGLLLLQIVISLPIQWTHWFLTKDLVTREQTHVMRVAVSPFFPQPLKPYAALFDSMQSWLILRHVCMRHQEHKVFWQCQTNSLPPRAIGSIIPQDDCPIAGVHCVGVPGWVYPHMYILDLLGLNDYVIARMPKSRHPLRLMAHNSIAPRGYIESYKPNFNVYYRILSKRKEPLTMKDIDSLEHYWRKKIKEILGN